MLARKAGASRRTIERLFAQKTGITVAEGEPVFKKAFGATPGRYAV